MHSTFPLAPEKMTIVPEQIPEALRDQCTSSTKLVTHLGPRKNYVVALRNLRFYLKHGMVLTKVHRVLTYKESPWLKEWVEFCTKKRAAAKNDFEKDFWKLMANAVYGKTMEDVRKRMKVYFVDDTKRFKRKVAKPSFQRVISLGDDFGICVHDQDSVLLNKPISTGFAVLEESKLLMYRFHYPVMIPFSGEGEIVTQDPQLATDIRPMTPRPEISQTFVPTTPPTPRFTQKPRLKSPSNPAVT